MKRYFLAIVVLALCLAGIGGTYAYTAVSSKAHNIITTGAVKIAVEEWQETEEGIIPYPREPVAVMPGRTVSKIVNVRNLDKECFVRVRIEAAVFDPEGNKTTLSQNQMDELLQLNIHSDFWQQKQDETSWWYYHCALPEKGVTEPLFESVVFDGKEMGNSYQGCSIQIYVTAQAVQAANNAGSALLAVGWPEE